MDLRRSTPIDGGAPEDYGLRTIRVWHEALDRLPEKEREYFIAALKRVKSS